MDEERFVADTSVIVEHAISPLVESGKVSGTLFVPRAVFAELEHQANQGQEIGFLGLEELQRLQAFAKKGTIEFKIVGERPLHVQITNAKTGGEIDALIAQVAYDQDATLITADRVQAESARAAGCRVSFLELKPRSATLSFEHYFDTTTMSLHLKEDCLPVGKRGVPGAWDLVEVDSKFLTPQSVENMSREIIERARIDNKSYIEIARAGSTIVQYRNYRIVITRPPVSDGWEITIVRPIKQLRLEEYNLPSSIAERLKKTARGVVISGETGSGKSTFAQALAEYYASQRKITKTIESPRDLLLSPPITQYSKNFAGSEEIHDILFLVRPDYILFDEMRDTPDFKLYTDLRLGGSNMLGVLHAATSIDTIHRFIGRLDVGMIPSVIDTIIFISKGNVGGVLTLEMTVKVPSGMTEADLARPVVVVHDFLTQKPIYEIYSYGEQTVVVPIQETTAAQNKMHELAARQLEQELQCYVSSVRVKMVSDSRAEIYVPSDEIARVIGKQGQQIMQLEKMFGLRLDVKELSAHESSSEDQKTISYHLKKLHDALTFLVDVRYAGKEADVYVDDHFLFSSTLSKKGELKVQTTGKLGHVLARDIEKGKRVELRL